MIISMSGIWLTIHRGITFATTSQNNQIFNIMKTSTVKLSSLVLTIGLLLVSFNSNSQETKMTRQEKKDARKTVQYANFQALDTMIQSRGFVLEADYLENQYGNRTPVTSTLNFVKVDISNVVLQTGSDTRLGSNDVGGTTAEGSIQNLKIEKDLKNLSFSITFSVATNIGIYDVYMTINSNRRGKAIISGLTAGKLIWYGRIESLNESRVFKGRNSI